MKTFFFILLTIIFCSLSTYSQENKIETANQRAQSVYLELGGNGVAISANYDVRFAKKQGGIGARAGIGYLPAGIVSAVTIPFGLNYLFGKGPNYFEGGVGITIVSFTGGGILGGVFKGLTGSIFIPSVGYRYQPLENGLTIRIFISPFIGTTTGNVKFWAGGSLGYKF